jgi:hypothetical protein
MSDVVLLAVLVLTSVWLIALVGVVGLCTAAKAAEASALSLPRSHYMRRGPRVRRPRRRAACRRATALSLSPARRG